MNAIGRLHFNSTLIPIAGWSETYFLEATDYTHAQSLLSPLATQRLGMMSSDCELVGGLISDTDVKGDSFPTGLTFPQVGTWAPAATDPTANITLALNLKFFAGPGKRGTRFLHGLPTTQVAAGGYKSFTAPFVTKLNTFLALVQSSTNLGTRIKGAVAPPFYNFSQYTSFQINNLEKRDIGRPFGLLVGRRAIG